MYHDENQADRLCFPVVNFTVERFYPLPCLKKKKEVNRCVFFQSAFSRCCTAIPGGGRENPGAVVSHSSDSLFTQQRRDGADGARGEDRRGPWQQLLPPLQRVHRLQPGADAHEVPAADQVQLLVAVVRPWSSVCLCGVMRHCPLPPSVPGPKNERKKGLGFLFAQPALSRTAIVYQFSTLHLSLPQFVPVVQAHTIFLLFWISAVSKAWNCIYIWNVKRGEEH